MTYVKDLDEMLEIQLRNVKGSEYMHGMYNGMEFMRSIVTGSEPVYVDIDGNLDKEAVKRNPERYL